MEKLLEKRSHRNRCSTSACSTASGHRGTGASRGGAVSSNSREVPHGEDILSDSFRHSYSFRLHFRFRSVAGNTYIFDFTVVVFVVKYFHCEELVLLLCVLIYILMFNCLIRKHNTSFNQTLFKDLNSAAKNVKTVKYHTHTQSEVTVVSFIQFTLPAKTLS